MQPPNPNPNPNPSLHNLNYHLLHQHPNPNANNNHPQLPIVDPYKSTAGLNPPGVDLYSSLSSYPQSHSHGSGYEVQQPDGSAYAHSQTVNVESVATPYYMDPNTGIPYLLVSYSLYHLYVLMSYVLLF